MFYNRAVIIYNPRAGQLKKGRAHRLVRAGETLRGMARDVILIPTHGPRTAGELACTAIGDGADLIIAAGGDGTISEVVNGMANSQVPLGILPAGTANVLAHEIGLRRNVVDAAAQMTDCVPIRISLGQIEMRQVDFRESSHYFLLMAGAGFDAEVIYQLNAGWKDRLGKLSYFLGGLQRIGPNLAELDVSSHAETESGQAYRCSFALISKVRNYGGDFEIATSADLRADTFEVVLFQGRNSWRYLWYLFGVATRSLSRTPGVHSFRADCVSLYAADATVRLQADGELIGRLPATVRIVPDALTLLMPPESGKSAK